MQESKDVEPLPGTVGEPKTALEYPLRALVRVGANVYNYGPKVGDVVRLRVGGPNAGGEALYYSPDPQDFDCELVWLAGELDLISVQPPEAPVDVTYTLKDVEDAFRMGFYSGERFDEEDEEWEKYLSSLSKALASSRVSGRTATRNNPLPPADEVAL